MCFLCYSCFFTFRFFFSHHLLSLVHQGEILTNNKNIPVINIFFLKLAVFIERKNASCLFNLSGYRQKIVSFRQPFKCLSHVFGSKVAFVFHTSLYIYIYKYLFLRIHVYRLIDLHLRNIPKKKCTRQTGSSVPCRNWVNTFLSLLILPFLCSVVFKL